MLLNCVRPVVVLRPGLPFRIGLHTGAAEIGNQLVDLVDLCLPPVLYPAIEGIGRIEPPSRTGAAKFADRYMRMPYGCHA